VTRALLITNPAAARTDARAVTAVRETLRRGGWDVDVLATAGPGDARRFASEMKGAGYDAVICYGGDGTAMQVAAGVAGTEIPLGIIPGGTGNILARNLRLPTDPGAAARLLLTARRMPIDLGLVERADGLHYFAVCCGAGFDAELMVATDATSKRRWKMAAYVGAAFAALPRVQSVRHRVVVDGVVHDVRAAMVLIANCGELFPPFVKIHHEVHPDDGWLDVVALRADGAMDGVASFLELVLGSKEGSPRVWFGRGRTIRVEVADGPARAVQLDGEPVGTTPLEARLMPHALTMLVAPAMASNGRGGRGQ